MITIKEEFLSSVKTKRAYKLGGGDAIVLWLALKGYVAAGNTGGFIPDEAIEDLPLLPKRWGKAMEALIDAGKLQPDGSRGSGLVHRVHLGYELHDYEDHGTPVEVEDLRRQKAREQKAARRLKLRHDRGDCGKDCPYCVRGQGTGHDTGQSADKGPDTTPDSPGRTAPRASAGTRPYASGPVPVRERDPQPSPAQPNRTEQRDPKQQASSEDLAGSAPPAEPERASRLPACPPDLWEHVPEGTRKSLDMLQIPRAVQEAHCRRFTSRKAHRTDLGRPIPRWISTWESAITQDWTDSSKRTELRKLAEAPPPEDPDAARRRRAELDAAEDARVRRELRERVQAQAPAGEDAKARVEGFLENFGR